MALLFSVKTREHLRRWAGRTLPRWGVVLGCLAVMGTVTGWAAINTWVVEASDTDGAFGRAILSFADKSEIWAATGVAAPGEYDELQESATPQGELYHILRAYPVSVTADGATTDLMVTGGTVDDMLDRLGITYDLNDELTPAGKTETEEGTAITLRRIEYKEYTQEEYIPCETEYLYTSLYYRARHQGISWVVRYGQDGVDNVAYREKYVDGELVETEEIAREAVTPMVTTVVKCYGPGAPVSQFAGPEVVDGVPVEGVAAVYTNCRATGYSAGPRAWGASGRHLTYGTVAINPNVIPYGSLMYITSASGNFVYGYAYAADTGIAMMDGRAFIDLYYETYDESVKSEVNWVNIYVLDAATAAKYKAQNDEILANDVTVGMQ